MVDGTRDRRQSICRLAVLLLYKGQLHSPAAFDIIRLLRTDRHHYPPWLELHYRSTLMVPSFTTKDTMNQGSTFTMKTPQRFFESLFTHNSLCNRASKSQVYGVQAFLDTHLSPVLPSGSYDSISLQTSFSTALWVKTRRGDPCSSPTCREGVFC